MSHHLSHHMTHHMTRCDYRQSERPLDALVCNAAVYLPTDKEPTYTADGLELSMVSNHLGHFLAANLLLQDLKERNGKRAGQNGASGPAPRLIIVGSITGNSNTVAGGLPPPSPPFPPPYHCWVHHRQLQH